MRSWVSKGWFKGVKSVFKKNSVQHDYSNKKHSFNGYVLCARSLCYSDYSWFAHKF